MKARLDNREVPLRLPAPPTPLALPAPEVPSPALVEPGAVAHPPPSPLVTPDPSIAQEAPHQVRAQPRTQAQRALLQALASGDPFDDKVAQAFTAILGAPIHKAGLLDYYGAALPGRRVRIAASKEKDHLAYTITWLDNLGDPVATLRRKLRRHDDGALELYGHAQWVDPQLRGQGVAALVFERELEWLKACSPHPHTRLTLWAGAMADPRRRGEPEAVGKYVWANFGFDFAEAHGERSGLAATADKPRIEDDDKALTDRALLKRQLKRFLTAEVEAGRLSPDREKILIRAVERLRHPWEIVALPGPGGARGLGKSFLLSKLAPRWEGTYRVNAKGAASSLAKSYLGQQKSGIPAQREKWASGHAASLKVEDPEQLKQALKTVGRHGSAALLEGLRSLRSTRPELEAEIDTAILQIEGKWVPPRPTVTYTVGGAGRDPARFEVPAEFKALEKATPAELAAKVNDGERRLATAALDILAALHSKESPEVVLTAAIQLYDRFPGDDHWWARRNAIYALGRLPDERGLPALIERAPVEDDINVMIALHQQLERAEDPAAEGPAEVLLRRIDALKAEIERALAEL